MIRSLEMTLTLLTPIILMITAAVVTVSALSARKSGFIFSSVHMGISVTCAFLAAVISSVIAMIFKESIVDMCASFDLFGFVSDDFVPFVGVFERLVGLVAPLILFIPVFVIILIIFKVVINLVFKSKIARLKVNSDGYLSENATFLQKNDKTFATIVGIVCGLFISIAFLSPVTGAFRSLGVVVDILEDGILPSDGEDTDESARETIKELDYYSSDITVAVYDACGGGVLYNVTTTFTYYGDLSNFSKELSSISEIDVSYVKESITDEEKFDHNFVDSCNCIVEVAEKSPVMKMFLAVAARELSDKWISLESFMDIYRPAITENSTVRDIFDEMLKVLATSDEDTVCEDVKTLIVLVDIISEYEDSLDSDDYQSITTALVSGNLLERLQQTLDSNPRMREVAEAADELLMRMVAEEISDYTRFTYEMRDDLFEEIAEVLKDTSTIGTVSRTNQVAEVLQSALEEYGVYTNESISYKIAETLITEIKNDNANLNTDDLREYFDNFLKNAG